jgi:hypothetical protein
VEYRLPIPLGRWIPSTSSTTAWHDPCRQDTYVRHDSQWHRYHHIPAGIARPRSCRYLGVVPAAPPDLRKAIAWLEDTVLQYHGSAPLRLTPTPECTTLRHAIDSLAPEWQCWALENLEWNLDPRLLAQYIRAGTVKAIADGSFKNLKGTAAFALVTSDGALGLYGMHRTPGPSAAQCSYRSENGGILGILLVCHLLHLAYGLDDGSLVIGCDNLESEKKCLQYSGQARPRTITMIR